VIVTVLGRVLGALGFLGLLLFGALSWLAPEAPGAVWLGAFAAIGLSLWVYVDWEALEQFFASRGGKDQTVSWALVLVLAGIGGLVLHLLDRKPLRWDLTEGQIHSLSEQMEQIVRDVPADVELSITGFYVGMGDGHQEGQRRRFQSLMEAAKPVNPRIRWEIVDPDEQPGAAQAQAITSNATVVLLAKPAGEGAAGTGAPRSERLMGPDEEELANGIFRVVKERRAKVYFVAGHGERTPSTQGDEALSELAGRLKALGFATGELETRTVEKLPEDATLLVLAGPRAALLPPEAAMIQAWVDGGGALLVALEPTLPAADGTITPLVTGLEEALALWGLRAQEDLILDPVMHRLVGDPTMPLTDSHYPFHEITDDMRLPLQLASARSLQEDFQKPEGVTVFPLARTTEAAWGETDLTTMPMEPGETDHKGPLLLAALAEIHGGSQPAEADPKKTGRVMLVGDVDWLSDWGMQQYGNLDFATRAIGHLAKQSDVVKIPAKEKKPGKLELDNLQQILVSLVAVLLVPGGVLLGGLIVWVWRKAL
jgi:ABC-type uncharacterized transport system involved in gliding motility auxiliary subunit